MSDPPAAHGTWDRMVQAVAALGDPLRRRLYRYVTDQPEPVTREQAAEGVGVALHAAKFHLDKLAGEGLLEVSFRRPPGRSGPGAGRPAKLYRRSRQEVSVSLPHRRYDLAGRLMAAAIESSVRSGRPVADALRDEVLATGRALGSEARRRAGPRPGRARLVAVGATVLAEVGFEPRQAERAISLGNCPFGALAGEHPELVCGMNRDLIEGFVDGLGLSGWKVHLEPSVERCCVRLVRAAPLASTTHYADRQGS